ncbi:hypothetical protein E4L95_09255 [Paracoccus liaowanqingii]|uniref:Uncharacterized protein n=1 Tax=Paracoccus liaowanqingii TaxID=2560053 RepID=A0A4Z1C436_9RHOB|nr:hypothetical protein [Paracoccus liaowanqingii]TGN61742.1 hypothetical protein E4L95_09255 [Paracoccus liaowanqingii]
MFEVGKTYEIVILSAHEDGICETIQHWEVKAIEGTLLHLHVPADTTSEFAQLTGPTSEQNMVLNTASCFFHSATLSS